MKLCVDANVILRNTPESNPAKTAISNTCHWVSLIALVAMTLRYGKACCGLSANCLKYSTLANSKLASLFLVNHSSTPSCLKNHVYAHSSSSQNFLEYLS